MVDLSSWVRGEREPGGDEQKRWYKAPSGSEHEGHWLFKPRRIKEVPLSRERLEHGESPDVLVRGNDWAEKIAYELAKLIEIPSVVTELASLVREAETVVGSMSRDMRPMDWQLSSGATLLAEQDEHFDADTCRGHTVEGINTVLDGITGPPRSSYEHWQAFDVFVGYLIFDAWIANTDRHPHNWGVLQAPTGTVYLAPSFDHGSCLGSGMGDDNRARVLARDVAAWCEKGRARTFDMPRRTTLIDVAAAGLRTAQLAARTHWRHQLSQVEAQVCDDVVDSVPELSGPTRSFIKEVLTINRRRLLDVI